MSNQFPTKIWIIDDDLVAQFNAKIKIRQTGIPCITYCFDNAHSALVELMDPEIPQNGLPDIIILDLSMPGIEGWDFLTQLAVILNKDSYPDIFISSSSRISADVNRAEDHSIVKGYFVKPLTPQNMELMMENIEVLKSVN